MVFVGLGVFKGYRLKLNINEGILSVYNSIDKSIY